LGGEDIFAAQMYASLLIGCERGEMVLLAPVQGGLMKINSAGFVGGVLLNPRGGKFGCATKIFADVLGFGFVVAFINAAAKVEVRFYMLYGGFI
jgi:hypothetical protein